jgi:hypothetical protein
LIVDAHDSITLHGVTTAQLASHPSDFHFFYAAADRCNEKHLRSTGHAGAVGRKITI